MKTMTRIVPTLLTLTLALVACDDSPTGPHMRGDNFPPVDVPTGPWPDSIVLTRVSLPQAGTHTQTTPAARSDWTTAEVVTFADPGHSVGTSRLKRHGGRVEMKFSAAELEPETAATLWAVVFNNPEACIGECDDPDIFENPATRADMMFVGGAVADASGAVRFSGHETVGATANSIMPLFGLSAWGILDVQQAEIHLVLRDHGPLIHGLRRAQTTTFNGGCTGFGAEFGEPGPNECVDLYFASHYTD